MIKCLYKQCDLKVNAYELFFSSDVHNFKSAENDLIISLWSNGRLLKFLSLAHSKFIVVCAVLNHSVVSDSLQPHGL